MTGSLASVHPELIPEWSEKNLPLTPDTLGHKDISTTLNIYTDVTKELRRSEFEGLDSYFKNEYNKANEVL